ncbi:MAG: c-type cytochrome domain-containing protein [Myxococcaceae bacterium]
MSTRSLSPGAASLAAALLLSACGNQAFPDPLSGEILFTPERPSMSPIVKAMPYTGADPLVLEAQTRYPTGMDLQHKVILRTCGPTNGVCHNQKEYPDLHTSATFMSAIGARCNVQPGSWSSVFDRCERPGDKFQLEGQTMDETEVGWLDLVPGVSPDYDETDTRPDEVSPGLHVFLSKPLPAKVNDPYGSGLFVRTFVDAAGNLQTLPFASYRSRWYVLADRRHLVATVAEYQADSATRIATAGILQGDQNRNGTFGSTAQNIVSLLNPGRPEESYLVARLRGYMQADKVPGTRMPLANQPPSIPDMLGLMCFIEGLEGVQSPSILSDIDYNNCSYIADPAALNIVGNGVTFKTRVQPLLAVSCGGCHGGANPQGGLNLVDGDVHARLLQSSLQRASLNLIQPGSPEKSYLWLKVSGDGSIVNLRMPLNSNNVPQPLPQDALDALQTWILAGALND